MLRISSGAPVIEIISKLASFSPPLLAFLFFWRYSTTGEDFFLVLTGVVITAWVAWLLFKNPLVIAKAESDAEVAKQLRRLSPSKYLSEYISSRTADEKYNKAYAQALRVMYSLFDVKGLTTQGIYSLELEQVFVKLNISPEQIDHHNPLEESTGLKRGNYEIWDFFNSSTLKHLAIIGVPGCGKTTLLKYIALALSHRTRQSAKLVPDKLPILLFIRDHAQAIADDSNTKLVDLIYKSLGWMKEPLPATWFEKQLESGHCLVMMDGLDEVGDLHVRQKVSNWIERQTNTYHNNRFIVSSRPKGYASNPIVGMTLLHIQTFNQQQIEKFVENWYVATEMMSQQKPKDDERVQFEAKKGAADLLKRIRSNRDLAELAINPLLLTMIANVHRWRSALPGRRVELYAEMCEVFLGKRRQAAGVEEILTPAQKQSVLQVLAYNMMQQNTREIALSDAAKLIGPALKLLPQKMSAEEFIHLIRDGSGILIERELQIYAFSHKTFQEFLAAVHVEKEKLISQILEQIDQDWWHETIRLYCARNDATPIVLACLLQAPPPLNRLVLAIECSNEALHLDVAVSKKVDELVEAGLDSDEFDRYLIATTAKLALRLKNLSRLDDSRYIDSTLISFAEFQLFLDENPIHTPLHWKEKKFPKSAARQPVVGVSAAAAQAFCNWLSQNDPQIQAWKYRLPYEAEILEDGSYWVQKSNAYNLSQSRSVQYSLLEWITLDTLNLPANMPNDLLEETVAVPFFSFPYKTNFVYLVIRAPKILDDQSFNLNITWDKALDLMLFMKDDRAFNLVSDLMYKNNYNESSKKQIMELIIILLDYIISNLGNSNLAFFFGYMVKTPVKYLSQSFKLYSEVMKGNLLDFLRQMIKEYRKLMAVDKLLPDIRRKNKNLMLHLKKGDFESAFNVASALRHNIDYGQDLTPNSRYHQLKDQFIMFNSFLTAYDTIITLLEVLKSSVEGSLLLFETVSLQELQEIRSQLIVKIQKHYTARPENFGAIVGLEKEVWQSQLEDLLQMYAQFVTLEMRCQGKWQAFEGIRIVREKVEAQ